jgi:hypothetical protein
MAIAVMPVPICMTIAMAIHPVSVTAPVRILLPIAILAWAKCEHGCSSHNTLPAQQRLILGSGGESNTSPKLVKSRMKSMF